VRLSTLSGTPCVSVIRGAGQMGGMSAALIFYKHTLSRELQSRLEKEGVVLLPLPKSSIDYEKVNLSTGFPKHRQHAEYLVLTDVGHAKGLGAVYMPLEDVRSIPGLENARIEHPLAGGVGNAMRFLDIALCEDSLMAKGVRNLFCAGERVGILGVTECIATGTLAGYNAARNAMGIPPITLPKRIATGCLISSVNKLKDTDNCLKTTYYGGSGAGFKIIAENNLYSTEVETIKRRIQQEGVEGVYAKLN